MTSKPHISRAFTITIFCLLAPSVLSQSQTSSQPQFSNQLMQQLEAITVAALTDDYAYRQLSHLTENIGPRPSGSAGAQAAVEYVAAQLRDLGLEVQLEPVRVPHWTRGIETAELVDGSSFVPGTQHRIVLTALGGSTSTGSDGIAGELLVVDNLDQLRALGREHVAGKIVLINAKFDQQKAAAGLGFNAYREIVNNRQLGPAAAAELGAKAALVRSIGSANYRLPHTGDSDPSGIPAASVCAEDADLVAHLAAEGPVRMHLTLTPNKLPDENSFNVIADLKGVEHPEQVVIVSGHLDSWDLGTGALDDGAGVVLAMQTAHVFKELHLRPKRTLRVIAWMDEEINGSGSAQYLKEHQGDLSHHVAAIECDTGAGHPFGFALKTSKAAADALTPLPAVLAGIGATLLESTSRPPGTTDVTPFSEQGVPVISIVQDVRSYYAYHHTSADTLDKVVPRELRENAAAMAVMAYALAEMKDPLPR